MNLVTTLDYYIQRIAEAAVNKAMETYKAKNAACVIMDYNTGEIVALAEAPAFDLNNVPRDDIDTLFARSKSMIVSNVYEPGSTFKILTAAAALNEGLFNEHSRFYCPGSRVVDGKKIRCWRTQGHGSISYAEGVERSCNCVFMDSALALGVDRFYDYMRAFGLHEKTGIDMKGETSGIFIAQESVKNVDLARIGFGQAVAVSPIELITATSAVVNGGVTVRPHIAKSAVDTVSGKVIQIAKPFEGKRVISESTSKLMNEMLKSVVTLGSGKLAHVPGYEIIGKTGTAQKYAGGTIAQGKYVSSFLGFSLTEGANYAVLFIVDEPQGYLYYGSLVAAPFVGEIYQQIFSYLNIQPKYMGEEAELYGTPFTLGDYTGMSVNEAMNAAKKLGLYVEIDGEGDVVKEQFPHAGAVVTKRNTILFVT
ncbi:MAG: PASTA domain-containing protein [Clostridiales bacterium]|nr:PASTA domain-containing protein [Clostridiales bacterium]